MTYDLRDKWVAFKKYYPTFWKVTYTELLFSNIFHELRNWHTFLVCIHKIWSSSFSATPIRTQKLALGPLGLRGTQWWLWIEAYFFCAWLAINEIQWCWSDVIILDNRHDFEKNSGKSRIKLENCYNIFIAFKEPRVNAMVTVSNRYIKHDPYQYKISFWHLALPPLQYIVLLLWLIICLS